VGVFFEVSRFRAYHLCICSPSDMPQGLRRGYSFLVTTRGSQPISRPTSRAIAFFDGQNLFHAVKEAFGYTYPNYDVLALAREVCQQQSWQLSAVRFYTGVHTPEGDEFWHRFWAAKLAQMGRRGVTIFSRELRYQNTLIRLPDGQQVSAAVGQEKGIDVRIALDVVSLVLADACDVALIFSQDQDLSEVADEVRRIAKREQRWIKIASAFPVGPTSSNTRGINKTDWIRVDKKLYDKCIDRRDYRPKPTTP
jgi:uncharacterized LabA/DUF88 family protein